MDDDFGDETELEIIIERGEEEGEHFATWHTTGPIPAKWLNPPRRIVTDGIAIYHPERFVNLND